MILNQPDFFARSATLNGAITGTDTQITLAGLSTRFTDAVAAGTVRYPIGPFRISDDDGFELIAITGHVSGSTFEVERGIQGTSEEAWADVTAVRAVVTNRYLTDTGLVNAQAGYGPQQDVVAYDDFVRPDGAIDGTFLPTGQQWEAGTSYVVNRNTLSTSGFNPDIPNAPRYQTDNLIVTHKVYFESTYRDPLCTFILAYKDADNYIYSRVSNNAISISKVVAGQSTTLASADTVGFFESIGVIISQVQVDTQSDLLVFSIRTTSGISPIRYTIGFTEDAEINDIMQNATHVGIAADGRASPRPEVNARILGYSARRHHTADLYSNYLAAIS